MKSNMATTMWLLVLGVLTGRALCVVELQQGLYSGLTVTFSEDTPQPDDPQQLLDNLKSFLKAGSVALNGAVSNSLAFADVAVLLPRAWNASSFGTVGKSAANLTAATVDIVIHSGGASLPSTLQSELCGVPGRQISVPLSFLTLTEAQQQQYGTPGNILAHEWAHYRWGVHDEHGYGGDTVYSATYGTRQLTSCSVNDPTVPTAFGFYLKSCPSGSFCDPLTTSDCIFCYNATVTADDLQASLGYLPALSLGKFCDITTHVRGTPSPQNVLCGDRSVMEVLELHPDYSELAQVEAQDLELTLLQETLGRVMFLLNTPDSGDTSDSQIDYAQLLDTLQTPLLSHGGVDVAITSYKAGASGDVQVDSLYPFTTVTVDNYGELKNNLPAEETRESVPDLASVLSQVLEQLDDYPPGTLLVIPVNNELVIASTLAGPLGESLHARRIKPLFLYPEVYPEMTDIAVFLQYSGARFVFSNDTSKSDMPSVWSAPEVQKFLDYGYVNDHPIVKADTLTLKRGETYEGAVFYQTHVARTRLAAVTASSVSGLTLSYEKYGTYRACDICNITDTTILLQQRSSNTPTVFSGVAWRLQLENNGASDIEVSITWSEEYYIDKTDELEVQVWSSEGREPVADVPQNQRLVLYASVLNYGKQVLSSRIAVKADLAITSDSDGSQDLLEVELLDDGTGVDIRRDDSVYSVDLTTSATGVIPANSVITVNTIYVLGNSPAGESLLFRSQYSAPRSGSPQASGLLPRDPSEEDCCGSFVESPNVDLSHSNAGFHLILRNVVPLGATPGLGVSSSSITLKRDIDPNPTTGVTGATTTGATGATPITPPTDGSTTARTTGEPTTTIAPTTTTTHPTDGSTTARTTGEPTTTIAPTTTTTTVCPTTTCPAPTTCPDCPATTCPDTGGKDGGAASVSVHHAAVLAVVAVILHFVYHTNAQ